MRNLWSDRDAAEMVRRFADAGEDLALRVYTSRLLGAETRLVMHGGGNTSVKTRARDIIGDEVEVLCVKGSGWDLAKLEPPGLPAVRLAPLLRLLDRDSLSDEDMVAGQRANLLDPWAPNPSVEALLHAVLPHKFVDHTHADAVLALTDQPDGAAICRDLYDGRVGLVPYTMPGFALAKACADVFAEDNTVEGLILLKHGVFTFGATAREAYERMIEIASAAEARLGNQEARGMVPVALPTSLAKVPDVAPVLRGLTALRDHGAPGVNKPMVFEFRTSPDILRFVGGAELARYAQAGPVTPDQVIRTKPKPLIVPAPEADGLDAWRKAAERSAAAYVADYEAYFERNNASLAEPKTPLDPMPRVVLVPGLGLFGLGKSAADAAVSADLAETSVRVITDAERLGRYESITEAEQFEVEYWSLEQAKLGKGAEKPLARHIVAVTGGASGIGLATARAFRAAGAEVAILDRDEVAAERAAQATSGRAFVCDVTDAGSVRTAFDAVVAAFGGLDILVSNAGAAWLGRIGEVDEAVLRQSFELNFYGHQRCAQAAVRIMRQQGLGGVLLFNASKQAVNPGRDFGPYGLPKAATLFLMRQYALDYGTEGIRANAVNADRIRSGLLTDDMITQRAKARGVSEADYMAGNLLKREVTADDVATAFVDLALARATTGAVLTVDGGNIAASLR